MNLLKQQEEPCTLAQLWHRGLPNIARYCIWPILIGNPLKVDKWTFDTFRIQLKIIQQQMQQLLLLQQKRQGWQK